jgi:hypothetical protein
VVVADAHRAQAHPLVVDDVDLGVIEALALVLDRDVGVAERSPASALGFCLNEPLARNTAPRNHAWMPRIGSTRLWKKLCLLPPAYS